MTNVDIIQGVKGCIYDHKGRRVDYSIKDIEPYYTFELFNLKEPSEPIICTTGFYQIDGYEYILIGSSKYLTQCIMEQHALFNGVTDYDEGLECTLYLEDRTRLRYTVIDIGKRFNDQIISNLYMGDTSPMVKGFRQIVLEGCLHYVKELFDE